jgi:hypothetical protein
MDQSATLGSFRTKHVDEPRDSGREEQYISALEAAAMSGWSIRQSIVHQQSTSNIFKIVQ